MKSTKIESRAHWLELRRKTVGASEIGSVIGVSPWRTRFETWLIKAGQIEEPDLSNNRFVLWGSKLEPVVAETVAEERGWKIRKVHRYLESERVPGMGATLDREVVGFADQGVGCLEIKTVDRSAFKQWDDEEPPIYYQLQLQHQLAVTERRWGAIGALIGGNELRVWTYERHESAIQRLEREVAVFWASIRENKPPEPDWMADADLIAQMHMEVTKKKVVRVKAGLEVIGILEAMHRAADMKRGAEQVMTVQRAKLLAMMDDAEAAFFEGEDGRLWHVSAPLVPESEVAAYTRKPYRRVTVNLKTEPKVHPEDGAFAMAAQAPVLKAMAEEEKR